MNTPTVTLEPNGLRIVWDLDDREVIFHIYPDVGRMIFKYISDDGVDIYHDVNVSRDDYYRNEEQDKIDQINEALNLFNEHMNKNLKEGFEGGCHLCEVVAETNNRLRERCKNLEAQEKKVD